MKSDVTRREANKIIMDMFAFGFLMWFAISCSHLSRSKTTDAEIHWAIPVLGVLALIYFIAYSFVQLKKGMQKKELYNNLVGLLSLACMFVYILIPLSSQFTLVTFALSLSILLLVASFFVLLFHVIKGRGTPENFQ